MPRKASPAEERVRVDDVVRERCRVMGRHRIHGHEPGTVAEFVLCRSQLDVLIEAGLLEPEVAEPGSGVGSKMKGTGDNVTPNTEGE